MGTSKVGAYEVKSAAPGRAEPLDSTITALAGKRFHFIGAGGVGMSGLAKLLLKHNAIITGSDQTSTEVTACLNHLGADIKTGHHPENLNPRTDAAVISAAIKEDNPELARARWLGLKVHKYAEILGLLFNQYYGIAIAGTHGKSTTSGWLAHLLSQAGLSPNFIVGAEIPQLQSSSGTGQSEFFVAEACEFDRSFLNLKSQIAAILNIEPDHLDYYKDLDEIIGAFTDFALGTKSGGTLIAASQDPNIEKLLSKLPPDLNCETFGLDPKCNWQAANLEETDGLHSFDVLHNDTLLGRTKSSLPGIHNVKNALAVAVMAISAGVEPQMVLELLGAFTGMDRRLMLKERLNGVTVLDDYAHHPTEIKASLAAIRQRYHPKRLWCIFQPHQYSRTRFLLDDFAQSFKLADTTIVPEIYFVRDSQTAKKQINSQVLVDKVRAEGSNALFIDGFAPICEHLRQNVKTGDIVVTMGAGDIWKVADEYIQWLRENR